MSSCKLTPGLKQELLRLVPPVQSSLDGAEDLYLGLKAFIIGKPNPEIPLYPIACRVEDWLESPEVLEAVFKNIEHPYFELRRTCGVYLLMQNKRCDKEIIRLLRDEVSDVRSMICYSLFDFPMSTCDETLKLLALTDSDYVVRAYAIRALAKSLTEGVEAVLLKALTDREQKDEFVVPSAGEYAEKILALRGGTSPPGREPDNH